MRHLGKVRDHRLPADVLTESQRQRRLHLIVGLRADDLAERDHLTLLVRDLETHDALARNDFDHSDAQYRERAGEVLRKARDLTGLDPRRGPQLEARHDGTGLDSDDLGFDAEVPQLHLYQARERLERLRRIKGLTRRRIVEQVERG